MSAFPVVLAHQLAKAPQEQRWLIDSLWTDEAVGIIGGEPKCYKSFLALDMAVSVASGTPCLRRFGVPRPGAVLFYAAEDASHIVRDRLEGICAAAQVSLEKLAVHVITVPRIRLDSDADRAHLEETVAAIRPKLLVLDPFVRLHERDENVSGEMAPLLAYLRQLQRRHHMAVVVVHHARKGAARIRAGQALRGSSEFHAWGDSNLYLRRAGEQLTLTVEQRAAASIPRLALSFAQEQDALGLKVAEASPQPAPVSPPSTKQVLERVLADASGPMTVRQIRSACRVRTATLMELLNELVAQGRARKTPAGIPTDPRMTRFFTSMP